MSKQETNDSSILISVEELIHKSIGNAGENCGHVDFKGIQTILHLLARQMRMLEQKVEIQVDMIEEERSDVEGYEEDDEGAEDSMVKEKASKDYAEKGKYTVKEKSSKESAKEKSSKETAKAKSTQDTAKEKSRDKSKDSKETTKPGSAAEPSQKEKSSKPKPTKPKQSDTGNESDSEGSESTSEATDAETVSEQKTDKKQKPSKEPGKKDKDKISAGPAATGSEPITSTGAAATKEGAASETSKTKKKSTKKEKGKTEKTIAVKEKMAKDDNVLVVERKSSVSVSSGIEVVTRSQFEVVAAAVRDLQRLAGPTPAPTLPDNKRLREDMKTGKASLSDTMNAMNVNARIVAAESAIDRLSSLVTQLTQTTGLPAPKPDDEIQRLYPYEPMPIESSTSPRPPAHGGVPATSAPSGVRIVYVTHEEMEFEFQCVRDFLIHELTNAAQRAIATADNAYSIARNISEKMDIAVYLDARINSLYSKVSDYAEQLKGFDSGIGIQLQGFQEQMAQMTEDLNAGLDLMENTQSNAENAAILELSERYEALMADLDQTLSQHQQLAAQQEHLDAELKLLVECVEILREQKADRDEVRDALKDKADISRLEGLLSEEQFKETKIDLENRLLVCYDKFQQQEDVWLGALKDLGEELESKADNIQVYMAREEAQQGLRLLADLAEQLTKQLGEPKAAMLVRKICAGAVCAACAHPALMNPGRGEGRGEAGAGAAPRLQAEPVPLQGHRCNRWAGGSHTLLTPAHAARAPPPGATTHTHKYMGYGDDGFPYHLEARCQPCAECNPPSERAHAAGDTCTPLGAEVTVEKTVLHEQTGAH